MEKLKIWTVFVLASILPFAVEAQPPPLPESGLYNKLRDMIYITYMYFLTGVRLYLAKEDLALKNYSFISASLFNSYYTDGLWCQSASSFKESVSAGGGIFLMESELTSLTQPLIHYIKKFLQTNLSS